MILSSSVIYCDNIVNVLTIIAVIIRLLFIFFVDKYGINTANVNITTKNNTIFKTGIELPIIYSTPVPNITMRNHNIKPQMESGTKYCAV
jgi:hypothetical protein